MELELFIVVHEEDVQEPTLTAIQKYESVPLGLENNFGPNFSIHYKSVSEELWNPTGEARCSALIGIVETAVFIKSSVNDCEVFPLNVAQVPQNVLLLDGNLRIHNLVKSHQACINIESRDRHSVIVIPEKSFFGVVITIDSLVWLLVLVVERKVEWSLPSRLSPKPHWLSVRSHFSFQTMNMRDIRNFIQKLGHHIKRRRQINWKYMSSFDIVGVDHIDWCILESQNGRTWEARHEIPIDLPRISEHFC